MANAITSINGIQSHNPTTIHPFFKGFQRRQAENTAQGWWVELRCVALVHTRQLANWPKENSELCAFCMFAPQSDGQENPTADICGLL